MSKLQFSTFFIDRYLFGVDVSKVQEVFRYQSMTQVPLAPSVIKGLINLRGQIVTAIDLRKRLKLKQETPKEIIPMNVVIRDQENVVSLLVDEIGDVLEVLPEDFTKPPENLRGDTRQLIRGVYKIKNQKKNRLLLVLDTQKVISLEPSTPRRRKEDLLKPQD